MADAAFIAPHPAGHRAWRISRRILYVLVVIVVLLAAARIALPYVLKNAVNHRLAAIPDYTGWVNDVGVSVWRGAYTLYGPVIDKRNGAVKEPFFHADEIDFSIAWRELLHGKFVSDITLMKPTVTFVAAPSTASSQLTADHRWQDVINDLFPIDITYLRIADGEVRYINEKADPKVDVRIAHFEVVATGLRNRTDDANQEFPARIAAQGETIGGGRLTILAQVEPLAVQPHFLLKLQLERVALTALNDFLRAYGNVDVRAGTFNGYVEAVARDGKFSGYFKPFFQDVDFTTPPGESRPLGQQVWETLVRGFAWVFKNHARDQVATRIPFSGEFSNIEIKKWDSFKNLARHAFVRPLLENLDSRTPAASAPKESPK